MEQPNEVTLDLDQKGVVDEFSTDFSKINLETEEELISNTTSITNTHDHNFHDHLNQSPIDGMVEHEDEDGETYYCGACGEKYTSAEFWIGCDLCEKWYHGRCVKITPAEAERIKFFKCPTCFFNNKKLSYKKRDSA